MLLDSQDCQLVLVDFQARLMPAMAESALVMANAQRLARLAHSLEMPCWGTEQAPDKLGAMPEELRGLCHKVLAKQQFSACGDELLRWLKGPQRSRPGGQGGNARSLPKHLQKAVVPAEPERSSIVLAGCETHVCLLQTALELLEEDFEVWVVTDACASRTERNRDAAFDRLAANGAELVTTEMVGFEWLRSAEHPQFKQFQGMIT